MESFGLRRTQSLKSLSEPQERSWVMPNPSSWNRKSVSEMVQHYQSCVDVRSIAKAEQKLQVSDTCADGQRWNQEGRESLTLWGVGRSSKLTRSRSMDVLPQRESAGTRALCALFESKVSSLQQNLLSSSHLDLRSAGGTKPGGDCPLQDSGRNNTPLKDISSQRTIQLEKGKTLNRLQVSSDETARHSHGDKVSVSVTKWGSQTRQGKDKIPTSSSVRERSALYLSRAAAVDTTGGSTQPEFTAAPPKRSKTIKMSDVARKITLLPSSVDDDDLPLPPPPPVPPRPLDYEEPSALSSLPVLPPKETFSSFYQQRQKTELKRLFKHIHPDLRASLDDAVDDEILQAVHSDSAQAADEAYQGEVQSMRWIFENWSLDDIGDPHATKKLLEDEELTGGDVRGTSSMFEHNESNQQMSAKRQTSVCGDVRTSAWLFETQPLDSLNKPKEEEGELVEALLKEPIQSGDVRGNRLLFESKTLSDLGRCNSIEDHNFLKLKSELQELKGDVQKTVKVFQAEPRCAIRDNSGNIHEIKSICREEINSSNTSTARWLFETQPLDVINRGSDGVKIIRGISLEEGQRGGVDEKRWMFETQPFDTIQEAVGPEEFEGSVTECTAEADVVNKKMFFEMQPLAAVKDKSAEQIIGGDVKTSMWLFETQPMDTLSDSFEVGRLKKITLSANEQGEVKGRKQMFESRTINENHVSNNQEIEKGDVKGFKHLFETIPLSKIAPSDEENIEEGNKNTMFEPTHSYAIKDSCGNLHKVTAVSREEFIKGKVKNYKWMFETKPLDKLAEGNVEIIKGITRQEDTKGDVNMAKWLFETQTIYGIHSKFNKTEQSACEEEESRKGDVKTCKWLFETQPMDVLYEKSEKVKDTELTDIANVKSITWLFESQPLDSIRDGEEYSLKLCSTTQDSVKPEFGVETVKHLFETETLDKIRKDSGSETDMRYVSQVDFQSGDVSRVKELFESQSLNEIGSEMESSSDLIQNEEIEKGSVHKYTWMFENCPMNLTNQDTDDTITQRVATAERGDVRNKKFVFETSSLDKINKEPFEQNSVPEEQPVSNVDVKSSTMMFESQALYAIRDKEGQFHEVTTVKKEEVMSGDVRGARWMFETKPLDAIKAENDVYVIRAVTQEDVKKGDVKSARWKFETQPLDSLTSHEEPVVMVTEDFGSTNVQQNKQIFECNQSSKDFVRMVSVTDVQHGDVRTSTWLFENQPIGSLKGEPQEQGPVKAVHREDSQKGDVKRCTWLFESQPLDKIKEAEDTARPAVEEEIPKSDVKCTTWLFETTPLDKITAISAADSLVYLYNMAFVHSSGIIMESNENGNLDMAKYLIENDPKGVQIQKEEVILGNIRNIMLELLLKTNLKPQVSLLREVEEGKVNTTVVELPSFQSATAVNLESDKQMQNIVQMLDGLLVKEKSFKKGIVMQETAGGQAEMSLYSLICTCETKTESHVIERGDIKSAIGNLLATASSQRTSSSCRVEETEKGNVNLYKSCIEKGDLHYLKSLNAELSENEVDHSLVLKEQIEIVQGDVKEAKRSLWQQKEQVERTISDVLPGDVENTKKLFSADSTCSSESSVLKDEIIPGDISSAKQQLAAKQSVMVEKEEIIAGDIKATMQSLELAKQQSMSVEREIITPGTIYDMDLSVHGPDIEGGPAQKEVIICGDVKAAKRSLEMAKQQSMHVEREVIVPGNIYNLNVSTHEERSSASMQSTCSSASRCQQIRTFPKVSDSIKDEKNHAASFEACPQKAVLISNWASQPMPPSVSYECNGQTTEDETEVVRGDVKAAIRSLQSAVAEQKTLDKEDIVRGNVQLALQSLEKSSVNVSKGDYKAAMIYRNSGRACSERSKTVHQQDVVVSLPPADTELSPSISVTCEGQRTSTTLTSTPDCVANGSSKSTPLPQKTNEKQKPALPPKPQWVKSITVEEPVSPPPDTLSYKDNDQSTKFHPKPSIPFPMPLTATDETVQDTSQTNRLKKTDTKVDEIKKENKTTILTVGTADCQMLSNTIGIEKNVIEKINAAEEIQRCMKSYAEDGKHEMNISLQEALRNFERKESDTVDRKVPSLSKKVRVTNDNSSSYRNIPPSHTLEHPKHHSRPEESTEESCSPVYKCHAKQDDSSERHEMSDEKVILRKKKRRETEDQRRQRLSVHKEEIMKGNVKAAMEIFENIRKREELKGILSQVEEIEEDTSNEAIGSLKTLYDNVPDWMDTSTATKTKSRSQEKRAESETHDDDLESVSSVETAYEDLEKASKEIMNLKQETLAKLLEIEETIKKALYSVSNLKSEADIAGLTGLFDESVKSERNFQSGSNIRKISIGSSKAKSGPTKLTCGVNLHKGLDSSTLTQEVPTQLPKTPLVRQSSSQSSPSFISIHSAARKSEQPKCSLSTFKPKTTSHSQSCHNAKYDVGQGSAENGQRKVSVLEVKTVPEQPAGIFGTKTVSETYEETDGFGNVFVSSTKSTFVTKQSDARSPIVFGEVGSPTRYEVVTSPSLQRSGRRFEDKVLSNSKQDGTVFVTFSQPKEKH